jgi:peptidoglycan/xylan/chitin deacetylase (PgdA/CDA1 family)
VLRKKEILARAGAFTGVTRIVESLPRRPSLLILNYHRIGDPAQSLHDSGAYSCTPAEFDWQVSYLQRRFSVVDLDEVVQIIHGRVAPHRTSVLLTFDDGYRDNYLHAFPVLQARGVSAAFFLPTAFIGTASLPWWDVVASIVKRSRRNHVALSYPEAVEFDLTGPRREKSIEAMLKFFKRPDMMDGERFIRELASVCGVTASPAGTERCFMNWDEIRDMQRGGMRFGSHSHSHEILGKLPYERQLEELRTSRRIIERELDRPIETLAYPDGQRGTFNQETFRALRESGYSTAFSFYSGINVPGRIRPYDVLRGGVGPEDCSIFRLRVSLRAATRRELF